jgi:hypothetical protein
VTEANGMEKSINESIAIFKGNKDSVLNELNKIKSI